MFREGQALYLQLKLLTAAHEILVVPKHMSPLHLSFFPAKYDAQRFVGSAKEWIGSCKSHKSCCEGAARKHQLKLRVLDCISGDLRELFQNQPYFCLSYAWGLPTYRQGAGPLALRSLPKTMEDAMYKTHARACSTCGLIDIALIRPMKPRRTTPSVIWMSFTRVLRSLSSLEPAAGPAMVLQESDEHRLPSHTSC